MNLGRTSVARRLALLGLPLLGLMSTAHAELKFATPANLASQLATLAPGDILELRTDAGNYTGGFSISGKNGTASLPITIRGPLTGPRPIIEGTTGDNVIRVRSSSYVVLQGLEVSGLGREGFAIAADQNCSHDIVIENMYIHDVGTAAYPDIEDRQQVVAIAANGCSGSSWNWTIRNNRIERVGTGMYLGNNDGSVQFFGGVIEYNTIIETIGYNIEIKHQNPRTIIAGMPTADSRTIIRHNVFSKSVATSSTGASVRPNLLVGHFPSSGPGLNDRYEIYGNFFYQNPVEALFQGAGNIYFYDNVMFNSLESAVNIQSHQGGQPRDVHIFNNTIVSAGNGISISGGNTSFVQEAFGNAVFAAQTPVDVRDGALQRDNLTGTMTAAATYLNNPVVAILSLDLFPKAPLTGTTINYTSVSAPTGSTLGAGTDWNKDFNGATQPGNVRGAYVGSGTNPGWKLALSTKPAPGAPSPTLPTVAINASPTTVAINGVSTLTWNSNGSSCVAGGNWTGSKASQGSEQVGPITATSNYILTCSNASGANDANVTVSLAGAPTVSLSANPTTVASGQQTTLTWSSTNSTGCVASGAWAGNKAVSGTEQSAALMTNSSFTLTCMGAGGSTPSPSVNVAVTTGTTTPPPPVVSDPGGGGGATTPLTLAFLFALSLAGQAHRNGTAFRA